MLCGLVLESDVPLYQDRAAPADRPSDVRVLRGAPVPGSLPRPPGSVLVSLEGEAGPAYSIVRSENGHHLMRFHGACDIEISADLREVAVHGAVGSPAGIDSVLTAGAMLALQLYLRGILVLHASAVELGGEAVAFVGRSGMGKSTMAALMCSAGAKLITDDVLRVDDVQTTPRARLGATELRLRKGADSLVATFGAVPGRRTSADERQVLRLTDDAADRLPLRAIVIPQPSPGLDHLEVERLPAKHALFAVLSFPRLVGWRDPDVIQEQFTATAALIGHVPVLLARVPWGPPFAPRLPADLSEAISPHVGP